MNKIVQATAGAGKTTGLLSDVYETYKSFYSVEGRFPKILISTFTIKAASELSERLIKKARELEDLSFLEYVDSPYLFIGTLHSTFLRIISKYDEEGDSGGGDYNSLSYRKLLGKSLLRETTKKLQLEYLLEDLYREEQILDLFMKMYEGAYKPIRSFSEVELIDGLKKNIGSQVESLGLPSHFRESFNQVGSFSNMAEWAEDLKNWEVLKENKKNYQQVLKILSLPENQEKFITSYLRSHEGLKELYLEWSSAFFESVQTANLFDMGDIEITCLRLAEKRLSEIGQLWDFCFFDEYQDTSPLQKEIIDLLTKKSQNYYVGDPFQSIYYFRGARKEIFDQEARTVLENSGEKVYRTSNYRSAPEIVNFVNILSQKSLKDFEAMVPQKNELKGKVSLVHLEEEVAEYEYVASCLSKVSQGKKAAILSRSTKELLNCGRYLKEHGFAVSYGISRSFENSLEIIELVALLRFLEDPDDEKSLLSLLFSSSFFVDDQKIKEAKKAQQEKETSESLWSFLLEEESATKLRELCELKKEKTFLSCVLSFLGNSDFLEKSPYVDPTGLREENIIKFVACLREQELRVNFNVRSFCDDILSGNIILGRESSESKAQVQLMTVHASKGLQFDEVFVIGANKKPLLRKKSVFYEPETGCFSLKEWGEQKKKRYFPGLVDQKLAGFVEKEKEESWRLLYVALTRAISSLYIIGSGQLKKGSGSWFEKAMELKGLEFVELLENPELVSELQKSEALEESGFFINSSPFKELESEILMHEKEQELLHSKEETLSFLLDKIALGIDFHSRMESFSLEGKTEENSFEYLKKTEEFPFVEILEEGYREWGYDYLNKESGIVESGKIDLWARLEDEIWIVDYKTGSLGAKEEGFLQLERYRRVLQTRFADQKLRCHLVLCFPFKEQSFVRSFDEL